MPAVLADSGATSAIGTELTGQGVDASLHATLLLAVAKAGYDVEPAGGGTPLAVGDILASDLRPVAGVPGLFVVQATLPDTSVVYRLVTMEEIAKGRRTPASQLPSLSVAGATPASVWAIAAEMEALRLPLSLLTPLLTAIEDAGYELSARAGGAVAAGSALTASVYGVEGMPGLVVVTVTLPDASTLTRVQNDREMTGAAGLGGAVL